MPQKGQKVPGEPLTPIFQLTQKRLKAFIWQLFRHYTKYMIKKSFCKHFQIIRKVILFILPTYHSKLHETISLEVLQTVCECLMVLLRKGSFSSNSCPSAVRAFSVLHPVCVLVRVPLVFDVRVLRFCLSLRFTRRRAAFYLRGRHREVKKQFWP